MSSATRIESAIPTAPYKGLRYYTEDDAALFFGRERERDVIIANLQARRLILLYGPSGVGKSSLLRAGVAARLREIAEQDREDLGAPEFIPVVFSRWRDKPLEALLSTIQEQAEELTGQRFSATGSLSDLVLSISEGTHSSVLVILDQFEDYSFYHGEEEGEDTFATQFAEAVNRRGLPVGFLLSLREDTLAALDRRFKKQIPTLFDYSLHVNPLATSAGAEAIRGPIDEWNRSHQAQAEAGREDEIDEPFVPVSIEDDLVTAVLEQVQLGRVVLDQEGQGTIEGATSAERKGGFIETPYLQLVMARLWSAETAGGSHVLRLATLKRLGNAETIVKTHLDTTLKKLTSTERRTAADVLRFLVTPSGTKIALDADALAEFGRRPREKVSVLLEELASGETRILRRVGAAPGSRGPTRYEIFHDVLAAPILDWRRRYLQGRREKRVRRAAGGVGLIAAAAAVAIILLLAPNRVTKSSPPAAVVRSPVAGARYSQDTVVRAGFTCHAAPHAQVSRCLGTVPAGRPVDTASLGAHVFRVDVDERVAGTGATQTTGYTIPYTVVPAFSDRELTAVPPAGWRNVEVRKVVTGPGGYIESKWVSPGHSSDYTVIDVSPGSGGSPSGHAQGVVAATKPETGYRQVSFGSANLRHQPSVQWIFKLPGTERVDYFFQQCGHNFAVLGAAAPGRFARLLPMFTAMANSVQGTCGR